jgi:hypothetical protein
MLEFFRPLPGTLSQASLAAIAGIAVNQEQRELARQKVPSKSEDRRFVKLAKVAGISAQEITASQERQMVIGDRSYNSGQISTQKARG